MADLPAFSFGPVPIRETDLPSWLANECARLSAYLSQVQAVTARTDKANTFDGGSQTLDFQTVNIKTVKGDGAGVGGWARGVHFLDSSNAVYGGVGSLGSDGDETYLYWGAGAAPWSGTVRLYPDGTLRQSASNYYHHDGMAVADTDATYENSWVDYDSGAYRSAGYRKGADGVVHLRGLVKDGTLPGVVFTLPSGCRPALRTIFTCLSGGGVCRVDVTAAGAVDIQTGSNAWVSLEGISFYADGS